MNNDLLEARWQQVGGQTRKWWGKLTDDDLKRIEGSAERNVSTTLRQLRLEFSVRT